MKKNEKSEKNKKHKKHREFNAGRIFGRIMAGILALMMVAGTCATLIYALI